MSLRTTVLMAVISTCGVALGLLGCSRSVVVVAPENPSHAEETVVARAQSDGAETESFIFPADAGGDLVAKALSPRESVSSERARAKSSRRFSASDDVQSTALPFRDYYASLPRLPAVDRSTIHLPRLELDESTGALPETPILRPPALPEKGRIRVPSLDVNEPIPLQTLGRPLAERASLDDPTLEMSNSAALTAPIPSRTTKAPFLKLTIPDPYEGRRTSPPTPHDSTDFPLGTPPLPPR